MYELGSVFNALKKKPFCLSHPGRVFSDTERILPFFASMLVSLTLILVALFWQFSSPNGGEQLPFDIISFSSQRTLVGIL